MELNRSQRAVVATRARRTLALSGAGTGKTAACVHWAAGLVKEGVPPSQILLLTFTKKGAAEMRQRANALIGVLPTTPAQDRITVGNYHSVGSRLLHADPHGFGIAEGNFTVLDKDDALRLWNSRIQEAGIEKPRDELELIA